MSPAHDRRWAVTLSLSALLLTAFYARVVPTLEGPTKAVVSEWFPQASLNEGLVWSICALGVHVALAYGKRVDLGFLGFWVIGGYVAGWLMSAFLQYADFRFLSAAFTWQRGVHVSFWVVLILGGVLCAGLGLLLFHAAHPGDLFAVLTWAVGVAVAQVMVNLGDVGGVNLTNGSRGIAPIDPIGIAGLRLGPFDLTLKFVVYSLLVATVIVLISRLRDRLDDQRTAYATAACLGGVGGVAFASHSFGVLPMRFDFSVSVMLLTIAVIGRHVWGVVSWAVLLTWLTTIAVPRANDAVHEATGWSADQWSVQMFLFGAMLVVRMRRRPLSVE